MRLRDLVHFKAHREVYLNGRRARPRTRLRYGKWNHIAVVDRGRGAVDYSLFPMDIDMGLLR